MNGRFGGMMSIIVRSPSGESGTPVVGSEAAQAWEAAALQVVNEVRLLKRCTSLGGSETYLEHRR